MPLSTTDDDLPVTISQVFPFVVRMIEEILLQSSQNLLGRIGGPSHSDLKAYKFSLEKETEGL